MDMYNLFEFLARPRCIEKLISVCFFVVIFNELISQAEEDHTNVIRRREGKGNCFKLTFMFYTRTNFE